MRQCFAYSQTAERCDLVADHDGPHSVSIEWTDDECFTPMQIPLVAAAPFDEPESVTMQQIAAAERAWEARFTSVDQEAIAQVMAEPEPVKPPTVPCVACGHLHQSGKCRCGCETYIP